MAQTIAVVAHKGGAGKTTVAVNLAGALVEAGRRVLVVDADPQGAAGTLLWVAPSPPTLYDVLTGGARLADVIETTALDALAPVASTYDVVIVDTAPGLGVLPYVALAAADRALAVTPPDFLGLRSVPMILESAERAKVPLIGIVANGLERRTRHEAEVLAQLEERHDGAVLPVTIPRRVVLRDAAVAGLPITHYSSRSDAADAFRALARVVMA